MSASSATDFTTCSDSEQMPPHIPTITLNAFKGGVSKTTTTYNLAWLFSSLILGANLKVLMVDLDSQCSLTQVFFGDEIENNEEILRLNRPRNAKCVTIGECLKKIVGGDLNLKNSIKTYSHPRNKNLNLLAGSTLVIDFEEQIAAAEISRALIAQNIPGAIYHIIQQAALDCGADVVLIDTSPSMGCMNMVTIFSSDYYIIPCRADFFSLQAVKTAKKKITDSDAGITDGTWIQRINKLREFSRNSFFPLPETIPKFLGVITQMFTVKRRKVTKHFQHYINEIQSELNDRYVPALRENNMLLPDSFYSKYPSANKDGHSSFVMGKIQNFNRFAPMAQEQGLPLVALLEDETCIINISEQGIPSKMNGNHLTKAKKDLNKIIKPLKQIAKIIVSTLNINTGK